MMQRGALQLGVPVAVLGRQVLGGDLLGRIGRLAHGRGIVGRGVPWGRGAGHPRQDRVSHWKVLVCR